jgi:translocator protein
MKIRDLFGASVSVFVCLMAGAIGSLYTTQAIPVWYAGLNKPFFSPPNWIFAPVWTALYIMMGISVYIVWTKRKQSDEAVKGIGVFAVQLILNTLWSVVFFGFRDPFLAFLLIVVLWAFIFMSIVQFNKVSRNAALLLVPYIVWVSFASLLNAAVWLMN